MTDIYDQDEDKPPKKPGRWRRVAFTSAIALGSAGAGSAATLASPAYRLVDAGSSVAGKFNAFMGNVNTIKGQVNTDSQKIGGIKSSVEKGLNACEDLIALVDPSKKKSTTTTTGTTTTTTTTTTTVPSPASGILAQPTGFPSGTINSATATHSPAQPRHNK